MQHERQEVDQIFEYSQNSDAKFIVTAKTSVPYLQKLSFTREKHTKQSLLSRWPELLVSLGLLPEFQAFCPRKG